LEKCSDSKSLEKLSVEQVVENVKFANACGAVAVGEKGCVGEIGVKKVMELIEKINI
jgi:hypothetical protein